MVLINLREAVVLRIYCKTAYPSILCHCKYSMKEHTVKIHLYFNMCYIILNLFKQVNTKNTKCHIFVKFSPIPIITAVNTRVSIYLINTSINTYVNISFDNVVSQTTYISIN